MCRGSIEGLRRFDNSGVLDLLDIHDEAVRAQFPALRMDDLMKEIYAVDDRGNIWRGARAINEIIRRQHGPRAYLSYLWRLPGFAWIADLQYKRIAGSRYEK